MGFECLVGGGCGTGIGYWLGFVGVEPGLGLEHGLGPGLGGRIESGWVIGGCILLTQRRWFVC